jgi:hypothetical protein
MKDPLQAKLLILLFLLSVTLVPSTTTLSQNPSAESSPIETSYDSVKDETTLRLLPIKISGERDKYYSLHMSPSFSYPGREPQMPSKIDFELQTVVKGRLKTDLYVVFIIDGETIFLSSSRQGIKRPVPGRVWMGEKLIFKMPFETLLKLAGAKTFEIKMDAVRFDVGAAQLKAIRDFAIKVQSLTGSTSTFGSCLSSWTSRSTEAHRGWFLSLTAIRN